MKFFLEVRTRAAALLISTALAAGLCGPAQQAVADGLPATGASLLPIAGSSHAPDVVPNFQKLCTGLWRGAAPSDEALSTLAQDGVKTIVDLRMDGAGVDKESSTAHKLGINYYHFALGFNKPEAQKVQDILAIMTDPVNQPVFVHCRQGADRTGMLCGIYRRVWQGWTFERTYEEMRQHHFKPFLVTMRQQVQHADCDRAIIAMRNMHPATVASVSTVTRATPAAPDSVPSSKTVTSNNLLVTEPRPQLN